MTTNQLFFAMATLFIAVFGIFSTMFYKYVDKQFDNITGQLKFLVDNAINHGERIAKLEERTKNK
jgi:hypothetical protein